VYLRLVFKIVFILLNFYAPQISAQTKSNNDEFEELRHNLATVFEDNNIVGAAVAVIDRDNSTWTSGFGYADAEYKTPVSSKTVFRVGSISKSVTGVISMRLQEKQLLDLNKPVSHYLVKIPIKNKWAGSNPVTTAHLLEHTAGFGEIQFHEYLDYGPDFTVNDSVRLEPKSLISRWRPGLYPSYTNSGPRLAGLTYETIVGRSFDEIANIEVFAPLGMTQSSFRKNKAHDPLRSESFEAGQVIPYTHGAQIPSGELNASTEDIAKLVLMFINRGNMEGHTYLSQSSIERIEQAKTTEASKRGHRYGYGLGNMPIRIDNAIYRGHNGSIDGFHSVFAYRPDQGAGFAILMNSYSDQAMHSASDLIAKHIHKHIAQKVPSRELTAEVEASSDLERYKGYYRNLTPRIDMSRIFENIVNVQIIDAAENDLVVSSLVSSGASIYYDQGNNRYKRDGFPEATVMFWTNDDGQNIMSKGATGTFVQVSSLQAFKPLISVLLLLFGTVSVVVISIIRGLVRIFSKKEKNMHASHWRWPVFLSICCVAGIVILTILGTQSQLALLNALGRVTPISISIMLLSILIPVLTLIGLLNPIFRPSNATRRNRVLSVAMCLCFLPVSFLIFNYGLFGLTIWSESPQIGKL